MIVHSFSAYFHTLLLLAFITGIGFSVITPSVNSGVMNLVASGNRAFSMGLTLGFSGLGGFLGAVLLPALAVMIGWRSALLGSGCFALVVSLVIVRFLRNPEDSRHDRDKDCYNDLSSPPISLKHRLKALLNNRTLLLVGTMGFVFGISISSISGHYTLYLHQDLLFRPGLAGLGLGLFQVGGTLGLPFWGFLNDKLLRGNRRTGLLILAFLVASLCLVFGFLVSAQFFPAVMVIGLSFILGFFVMGMSGIYFTWFCELVPTDSIGVATGLALIFIRVGVVLSPPLFGLLADIRGGYAHSWLVLGASIIVISSLFLYFSAKYKPDRGLI